MFIPILLISFHLNQHNWIDSILGLIWMNDLSCLIYMLVYHWITLILEQIFWQTDSYWMGIQSIQCFILISDQSIPNYCKIGHFWYRFPFWSMIVNSSIERSKLTRDIRLYSIRMLSWNWIDNELLAISLLLFVVTCCILSIVHAWYIAVSQYLMQQLFSYYLDLKTKPNTINETTTISIHY